MIHDKPSPITTHNWPGPGSSGTTLKRWSSHRCLCGRSDLGKQTVGIWNGHWKIFWFLRIFSDFFYDFVWSCLINLDAEITNEHVANIPCWSMWRVKCKDVTDMSLKIMVCAIPKSKISELVRTGYHRLSLLVIKPSLLFNLMTWTSFLNLVRRMVGWRIPTWRCSSSQLKLTL